jgi:hypothetical protein
LKFEAAIAEILEQYTLMEMYPHVWNIPGETKYQCRRVASAREGRLLREELSCVGAPQVWKNMVSRLVQMAL